MTVSVSPPLPRTPSLWVGMSLSVLSGMLWMLSFPNGWFPGMSTWSSWLALIALVPYLWNWRRASPRRAFATGWVAGFVYFLGLLSWLRLINQNTNLDNAVAWVFFSACGGVYIGLFGATARMVSDRWHWPDGVVLPLAWTAWEYIRGHFILGGWPWGSLGHTQYANPVLRQAAAVAGVGGVSFLVMAVNVAVLAGFDRWQGIRHPALISRFGRAAAWTMLAGALALAGVWGWDAARYARAPKSVLQVALVQGNINTRQRWDTAYKERAMTVMERLHLQAVEARPDLIVWAESCFPGILEYPPEQRWEDRLRTLVASGGIPTVLTSNEYSVETGPGSGGDRRHHYNSAFLLSGEGRIAGRYRKIRLVPFGEYIPWEIFRRFLRTVVSEPLPVDFEPGTDYTTLPVGEHRFGTLICYDDQFEELGIRLVRQGADFFLALANDGWAGGSAMAMQHALMSLFLAVEHRVPIAKADMTWPTFVIDAWGRTGPALPPFQEGVQIAGLTLAPARTFYSRFGNLVPLSLTLLFGALLLGPWIAERFRRPPPRKAPNGESLN